MYVTIYLITVLHYPSLPSLATYTARHSAFERLQVLMLFNLHVCTHYSMVVGRSPYRFLHIEVMSNFMIRIINKNTIAGLSVLQVLRAGRRLMEIHQELFPVCVLFSAVPE